MLYLTYKTVLEGGSTADVYRAVDLPLKVSQTAAVMEVVHALAGLVRSPVGITGAGGRARGGAQRTALAAQ